MIDMDKGNLNKLVTNYPVELTPEEVENLSQTLSSVRTAREDDKTYTGEGFVNVNNTNNVISLTNEANEKLNQPIPTKVSDLTDSASYQTVSGMDEYLTKTSASENLAPLSITDDIESLKNASSDWNKVSAKLDTTAFSTVSGNYAFKNDLNDYYQKTETSSKGELDIAFESKQDKLIFGYDENNAISSINNTTLAGQDVTTYSAGQYIEIDENNTISVTGLLPLDEYSQYEPVLIGDSNITATSSKVDSHTQWNLAINSKPVVIDTKLVGENSITAHTTNVSGEWVVGLEESAHNAIASVAGIATDVGTLKNASAGWDKVSDKLDVTAFSTVSGTFLTEIPDTYATKNDLNTASSTLTGIDNDLSGYIDYVSAHSITSLDDYYTKTQVDSTFALKTEIPTTVTQLTDSGNYYQKTETSSKTEITNALNTKVDNPSQQTGLLVYDGDISAWVSMPPDTTIVQGQGSITSNYESNSTYTVSLLASAENALKKVVNKIDTTAVEQKYQTKDDMSNYLTTSEASTTYQPIGDYATQSDINDMATQTWVGQQGFYTKASADNDYAPKTITATVNTLTGASASWNEVSAKLDSSVASTTYQTKADMEGYLTKNEASTTYQPTGNYLVANDITGKLDKSIYSNASGKWENASNVVVTNSANWNAKVDQGVLDDYYEKTDTSSKTELSTEFAKYQVTGDYATQSDISDMATKTWVGEQGFYTKASGDNDYAPKTITATVNTLTNASAGWNEVSSKLDVSVASTTYQTKEDMNDYLTKSDASTTYQPIGDYLVSDDITGKLDKSIYSNASGNWENTYNTVNQYSAEGTWLTAHQSLTNYYTKSETSGANELADEFTKYITSGNITAQDTDYVMTTTGWKELTLPGGGMTQVIHDETLTGQGNADNSKLGLAQTAYKAITSVSSKLDTSSFSTVSSTFLTKSSADNDYAPISITTTVNTLTVASAGWNEVSAKLGTAQYATDSAKFVTSSSNTITGTKQYALTTAGWAEVSTPTVPDITATSGISADGFSIGLTNTAIGAITSVSSKVDIPDTTQTDLNNNYLIYSTLTDSGATTGWMPLSANYYSKSESNGIFVATANIDNTTLSGDGKSSDTKLGVKTDVIATKDYVNSSFLPLSGGTVSGKVTVSSSGTCLLAVGTEATLMGQSRVVNMGDTTARGTNWLGVSQSNAGFIKYVNGGNVGDLEGTSIQINFAPDGANSYGNITVNSQDNMSKIINVPTASYNSMSSFDSTNGPNYMLRKTASGFDIGAAVINVTELPQQTEANAYYFVYDT